MYDVIEKYGQTTEIGDPLSKTKKIYNWMLGNKLNIYFFALKTSSIFLSLLPQNSLREHGENVK